LLQGTYSYVDNARGDQAAWADVISALYQPLATKIVDPCRFRARISRWNLEEVGVYRYESDAVLYRRTTGHIAPDFEENFFVTIPHSASASLTQNARTAVCMPGQFMMHYSMGPSELRHGAMRATVVRLPARALRERIRAPVDRCALAMPCQSAAGALFIALVDAVLRNVDSLHGAVGTAAGDTLADLLVTAFEARHERAPSLGPTARAAHRTRVMRHIAERFHDPSLTPAAIAAACGISVRYLHQLFTDSEFTVTEWIMESRLTEARRLLSDARRPFRTVADIAHRCGFEDPSHFSRRFRTRFGETPGEVRNRALASRCHDAMD